MPRFIVQEKKPVRKTEYRRSGVDNAIRGLMEQAYAACKTLEESDSSADRRMMSQVLRRAIETAQSATQIKLELMR